MCENQLLELLFSVFIFLINNVDQDGLKFPLSLLPDLSPLEHLP